MSAQPINLRADIEKLAADGLRVQIIDGTTAHLLIDKVPALTSAGTIQYGVLWSPLELDHQRSVTGPACHQCWWIGDIPCISGGGHFEELLSDKNKGDKGDGVTVNAGFSRRPDGRDDYVDYREKLWVYIDLLWDEAKKVDPSCTPLASPPEPIVHRDLIEAQNRIFGYPDMASARAGIGAMTAKLMVEQVAIIGLGGTGSYILDAVAKTMVTQIHLFDGDTFEMHNAFRAPGAPAVATFALPPKKVEWFKNLYDRMHAGIVPHPYHIDAANLEELRSMSCVFVAIDDSEARGVIVNGLAAMGVPFIDVGMDMEIEKGTTKIGGTCRVTIGKPGNYDRMAEFIPMKGIEGPDIYRNIQVADMNMLNAALAVIKWKKAREFYVDDGHETNLLYTLDFNGINRKVVP